jgi:hypothetical protein
VQKPSATVAAGHDPDGYRKDVIVIRPNLSLEEQIAALKKNLAALAKREAADNERSFQLGPNIGSKQWIFPPINP